VGAAVAALAPEEPKPEAQPSPPPAEPKPATRPSPPPPPAAPAENELAKFKVSSVVVSGKVATAIINGRVVGVGDTIDGAKILAITRHSIDMEINGHPATLRM
jgi:MSHA biogenesis protein MshK